VRRLANIVQTATWWTVGFGKLRGKAAPNKLSDVKCRFISLILVIRAVPFGEFTSAQFAVQSPNAAQSTRQKWGAVESAATGIELGSTQPVERRSTSCRDPVDEQVRDSSPVAHRCSPRANKAAIPQDAFVRRDFGGG
jgi:hypothetical protein